MHKPCTRYICFLRYFAALRRSAVTFRVEGVPQGCPCELSHPHTTTTNTPRTKTNNILAAQAHITILEARKSLLLQSVGKLILQPKEW